MIEVNLWDNNFAHSKGEDGFLTATKGRKPLRISYIEKQKDYEGVSVFTDGFLFDPIVQQVKSKYKVAWLIEPPSIYPYIYQRIPQFENNFDYIFTYDSTLLNRNPDKYKLCIFGGSQVPDEQWWHTKENQKTKGISIIASGKNFAEGHRLRHEVIKRLQGVDVWGSGYKKFDQKAEALEPYMYSIVIQNTRCDNYINEALLDCLAFRTIPIFWGCPNYGKFFQVQGFKEFVTLEDLANIRIDERHYRDYATQVALRLNIDAAWFYRSTDDNFCDALVKTLNLQE
jgi:hypothetical protein